MEIINANDIDKTKGTYLIYAPPGMGKTSSIKYFEGNTLVLDVDRTTKVLKGQNNVDIAYIDTINTWESWTNTLLLLESDYMNIYDNIVVDNISELERCLLSDLGSKGKNNGVPSQGDYQYMQFKIVNSLRFMKSLNANIIWTAWESDDTYTSSNGQQFNRSFPQLNKKISNNVMGLCDVVARLMIDTEGKRGFVLSSTNSIYAKNQLDDRAGCLQNELILNDL